MCIASMILGGLCLFLKGKMSQIFAFLALVIGGLACFTYGFPMMGWIGELVAIPAMILVVLSIMQRENFRN